MICCDLPDGWVYSPSLLRSTGNTGIGAALADRCGYRIAGYVRGAGRFILACGLFLTGCSNKDSYTPPDLLYLFATYPVGKNPTSVVTWDFNEDGITDILTTNIG